MTEHDTPPERDFTTLPPRVRPEDMVEMQEEEQLNETGAPAGDPGTEFYRRYS
jgi:hypothetical protein